MRSLRLYLVPNQEDGEQTIQAHADVWVSLLERLRQSTDQNLYTTVLHAYRQSPRVGIIRFTFSEETAYQLIDIARV